jgi:hypothetical protein
VPMEDPDDLSRRVRGAGAGAGIRLSGSLLVVAGAGLGVVAAVVGVLRFAPEAGIWQALSLVFSVAALTGQATPVADDRFVIVALSVLMASALLVLAVGVTLLCAAKVHALAATESRS